MWHWWRGLGGTDRQGRFDAIKAGHLQVHEDGAVFPWLECFEGLTSVADDFDIVAEERAHFPGQDTGDAVVLDRQNCPCQLRPDLIVAQRSR